MELDDELIAATAIYVISAYNNHINNVNNIVNYSRIASSNYHSDKNWQIKATFDPCVKNRKLID